MKPLLFAILCAACISACATSSSSPITAWGKQNVSMLDYRTDGAQCAIIAAQSNPEENGANTAGGINGQNGTGRVSSGGDSAISAGATTAPSGGPQTIGGGGVYRDSAPPDLVQRAANQQRAREMAVARARTELLRSCLTERGYSEFALTAEQRKHLATLAQGSDERRDYLYKLGTDPSILETASSAKK